MKCLITIAVALSLAACSTAGQIQLPPAVSSTPVTNAITTINNATSACNATTIDETVLTGLWQAFDGYLTWIDDQHLVYGSPKALAELAAESRIRAALEGITSVHNACSGGSWVSSLSALKSAYTDAQNALK